jgi:hypothetical protein
MSTTRWALPAGKPASTEKSPAAPSATKALLFRVCPVLKLRTLVEIAGVPAGQISRWPERQGKDADHENEELGADHLGASFGPLVGYQPIEKTETPSPPVNLFPRPLVLDE